MDYGFDWSRIMDLIGRFLLFFWQCTQKKHTLAARMADLTRAVPKQKAKQSRTKKKCRREGLSHRLSHTRSAPTNKKTPRKDTTKSQRRGKRRKRGMGSRRDENWARPSEGPGGHEAKPPACTSAALNSVIITQYRSTSNYP